MIYLIHGDNQVDSRRFLVKLKVNYQDMKYVSGKNLSARPLEETLVQSSQPLFGGRSAILIENFTGEWNIFPKNLPPALDIILWSNKQLELPNFPVKSLLFKDLRKLTSFKLVDAILFRDEKTALSVAHELLASKEPIEKIIGALLRGFCLVFTAKEETLRNLPLAPFAQKRTYEQANLWSKRSLRHALAALASADISIKSGVKTEIALTNFISKVTLTED